MGTAETDKNQTLDISELKAQKNRQRAILKRRASQLDNYHSQNKWNMCTDLQRKWTRRRLRRLFSAEKTVIKDTTCRSELKKRNVSLYMYAFLTLFIAVWLGCCSTWYLENHMVLKFIQRYSDRYQALVHNNLNYCNRSMPLNEIFERLRENVLNQEVALSRLERTLANQSSFQSIALVGSSGVGKSLTMSLLLELYPWSENAHSIAWNDYDFNDEESRYLKVGSLMRKLAHCGRNLLIIDNMFACDVEYVSSINNAVLSRNDVGNGSSDLDLKQLTIIYIFNLNRMLPDDPYDQQLEMLQNIPQTTVITYRSFEANDLERCVRHEAKLVDLHVEERYIKEMINATDVKVSGCKTARAKVLLYGYPQSNDQQEHIEPKNN